MNKCEGDGRWVCEGVCRPDNLIDLSPGAVTIQLRDACNYSVPYWTHTHTYTYLGTPSAHVVSASQAGLFSVEMSHPLTSPPRNFVLFSKKLQHTFTSVQFNIGCGWGKKIKCFIELAVERDEILSHSLESNLDGEERVSVFPPNFQNTVKCSDCFFADQPATWNSLSLQRSHTFLSEGSKNEKNETLTLHARIFFFFTRWNQTNL